MKVISRTGRRRAGAALALLVAVGVVVVVILTSGSSPSSPNSSTAADETAGAATVERRNLVETDTESGTLSYSNPQTVYNRLSGTITWLPTVGQEIRPGGTLYKVDGQPVVMLDGSTPAYRDLHSGISPGADILELNRNLVRLGFDPDGIVIDDTWQAATTAGIEQFQDSLGVRATGSLPLGQVIFLPGDQLIGAVEGTLGNSAGGSTAPPTSADASLDPSTPRPEFVDLTTTSTTPTTPTPQTASTTTTTTSTTTTPSNGSSPGKKKKSGGRQTLAALIALLKAEIAQLKASQNSRQPGGGGNPNSGNHGGPHNNGKGNNGKGNNGKSNNDKGSNSPKASNNSGGGGGGGASEILLTTSTHLVVTVDLNASVQSEAVVGEHVQVQMPGGNFVNGTVTAVSSIAQNSSNDNSGNGGGGGSGGGGGGGGGNNGNGSGSSSTVPVTITLKGHHAGAGLDQAAVSVNFAQQKANNVLSVPVTALLATSGGNYAVQEAASPHKLIPVTTGLFAAGDVRISGPGIYPGLQVTDSQG